MTAAALIFGKRPDGTVRRYGLDPQTKLIHVLASKTGRLAYCGVDPKVEVRPSARGEAVAIERRTSPQSKGYSFCRACLAGLTPQPDPAIWGPPRKRP